MKTLALVSGGLDSTIAVVKGIITGMNITHALFVDYGQRAGTRERKAVRQLCYDWGIVLIDYDLNLPAALRNVSSLTTAAKDIPNIQRAGALHNQSVNPDSVWVPNRNTILISVAAGVARGLGCEKIVVGFNASNTMPDGSIRFVDQMNALLNTAIPDQAVSLSLPVYEYDKAGMLRYGMLVDETCHLDDLKHRIRWDLIWSCWDGDVKGQCGVCGECMMVKQALETANAPGYIREQFTFLA